MSAENTFNRGQRFPYDNDDEGVARDPMDWAVRAARGAIAELSARGGLDNALDSVDREDRPEIVDSLAEIIRFAARDVLP